MSNFKTLTTIAIAALFAAPAFAQDTMEEVPAPTAEETLASNFISADLNQDGSLAVDEFVTFAVMRAEDGDEVFKDLVLGGEFDTAFVAHDADASGSLEMSELQAKSDPDLEGAPMIVPEAADTQAEDIAAPDLN